MTVELRCSLPLYYGQIPLDEDPRPRAAEIIGALPGLPPGAGTAMTDALAALGSHLRDRGAIEAGQVTLPDQPPDISALLVLAVTATPASSVDELAESVRHPMLSVRTHGFSGGQAVIVERAGTYRPPGAPPVPGRGIQVLMPTPDGDELVVLDVSTSHEEHWERFAATALTVADTLRFA